MENKMLFRGSHFRVKGHDKHGRVIVGVDVGKDEGNGVALYSMAHPGGSLWKRIVNFFRRPKLRGEGIETMEIEIPEQYQRIRIPIGTIWSKEDGKYVPLSSRPELESLSNAMLDWAMNPVDKHGK